MRQLLEEAGATLDDIFEVTAYIADRAFRELVYRTIGQHLTGVHRVGTGLMIVGGLASTRLLREVDAEAVVQG